ncbi:MAG: type IV pilin protein [Novipirellula sp. JB048]
MLQAVLLLCCICTAGAGLFVVRCWATERSRVATAFEYLKEIQHAQQRYFTQTGTYADRLVDLDLSIPAPAYYAVGELKVVHPETSGLGWRVQLERVGAAPLFGGYAIAFDGSGFVVHASSVHPWGIPAALDLWAEHEVQTLAQM